MHHLKFLAVFISATALTASSVLSVGAAGTPAGMSKADKVTATIERKNEQIRTDLTDTDSIRKEAQMSREMEKRNQDPATEEALIAEAVAQENPAAESTTGYEPEAAAAEEPVVETVDTASEWQEENTAETDFSETTGEESSWEEETYSETESTSYTEETGEDVYYEEEISGEETYAEDEYTEESYEESWDETETEGVRATVSASDLDLLAAIIQCEAGGESYEGKVAVGAVVLNRMESSQYPDSMYDVIYQPWQFTPAMTGGLQSVLAEGARDDCYEAAQAALNGENPVGDCLYFHAGGGAGLTIGNQTFY